MTAPGTAAFTPYSTAKPFLGAAKSYLDELESDRVLSYEFYEKLYWNVTGTMQIVTRGSNSIPIYVPSARTCIETMDRYVATDFGWDVVPESAPEGELLAVKLAFQTLFARERFLSKFDSNKLFGLIRGDWAWHILADPLKLPGSRISIRGLDPASFRKLTHPADVERVLGYDIFEEFDNAGTVLLRVQRYSFLPDPVRDPLAVATGVIYTSTAVWEPDAYADELNKAPVVVEFSGTLPPQITALPVYHVRNVETPGDPFGSSELRGFETLLGAVNQAASDEDLALALEGLGVYVTTSGPPRDRETKRATSWKLGPGRIAELQSGTDMKRITGVGSVAPYQDHLHFLIDSLREASGATDAAAGKVDVTVAESGISLMLQLGPILSKVKKKDRSIVDIHTQMFFDLTRGWFPAYEQQTFPAALVVPVLGPKLPTDKAGEVDTIIKIVAVTGLVSWGVRQIEKLGYDFTAEEIAAAAAAPASADPFADRAASEVDDAADLPETE